MLRQRTANLVFLALLLAAAGYFAWVAEGFVTTGLLGQQGLPSKFFPQVTLGLLALCAVVVAYQYVTGQSDLDETETCFRSGTEARQGLLMLGVAVICYGIWRTYGFLPMAVLMGPLSLAAMGVRSPIIYVIVWVLTAFFTVVFIQFLGVRLL